MTETKVRPDLWPVCAPAGLRDEATETRVAALLAGMTVEEKVGQIIQADIASIEPADLLTYRLGSILNGANSAPGGDNHAPASAYLALADAFYEASVDPAGGAAAIPVLWGTDAVHGHNNIVGATIFPHNIGLGAARDPDLIREIGRVTAREMQATGMDWTFAPTLAVARDDRWGRTYESYSEDPEIVAEYAAAMVEGLQGALGTADFLRGEHVIATAKHFLGDGGTKGGVDQGDNPATEEALRDIHAAGYPPAIAAGVQTVMASFNSWRGEKLHGHRSLLTDILKGRMGFDGFVVGDWNGHGQVEGCTNDSCAPVVNAGVDMVMAPDSWRALYRNTLEQVRSGEISTARLDDAVRRILRVKVRYGLFERGRPSGRPNAGDFSLLGAPAHRALARRAVRESLVLLKNNGGLLPLDPRGRILVAGDGAHNIPKQCGGWTITWLGEGNVNDDFPNGQSIYDGLREAIEAAGGQAILSEDGRWREKPDAAIVVFGENPYAEFQGDRRHLDFEDEAPLRLMRRLKGEGVPVVAVFFSGRPLYVNPEINAADAFVAAFLPGTEGGGVADVLLRRPDGAVNHDFTGRLSFSWPKTPTQTPLNRGDPDYDPLFPYGYGLSYRDPKDLPRLDEAAFDPSAEDGSGEIVRAGRARPPYRMILSAGDETVAVEGAAATTADGRLRLRAVDRKAQEDARLVEWTGPGRLAVEGPAQDLTRQASARMALVFSYAVDVAPAAAVRVGIECGERGAGLADMMETFRAAEGEGWRRAEILLSDLVAEADALRAVVAPFVVESDGPLGLRLSDIRIAMRERAGAQASQED
ncbi:glycoside hydrolase family 3 protein [Amphiplicatus metriothermophilus]|uniref:Beta-glucosidase n=1 Tax=Amphiplicatus metriothermophilus TaxID=1519374 RepID=A0A239PX36_9PROT|nr:glycoside hydrolase family 3 protein [Amphiplicatus metriothermophilus]MBB5519992.1 beta-glucosidase [Amphiplicatus metriothermophilus]SNT74891.1 beta-glucosidase [Amphiplicatus metriothermophilus]